MKKEALLTVVWLTLIFDSKAQAKNGNETPVYSQIISWYDSLDKKYPQAVLLTVGQTNSGKPLHLFVISKDGTQAPVTDENRVTLLINNGIHPGEPDGINASMDFCAEILANQKKYATWLDKLVICVVPVYNVDGALNRSCCSRANQLGPAAYGFRGNARNLDLNRDFIKNDSENAKSFVKMFRQWKPHVLVDTHVSNGSDYQYTFTYILTQKDKLSPVLQPFYSIFDTELVKAMKKRGHEIAPYVNTVAETPDKGIAAFIETPRFCTGYAALFNCFGITIETHMLKPFEQRVKATYDGLIAMAEICVTQAGVIIENKKKANAHTAQLNELALNYHTDTAVFKTIPFKGYAYSYPVSSVTQTPVLFYDRKKPVTWNIRLYENCVAATHIAKPRYYLVPQAWKEVIERLQLNGVEMYSLHKDSLIPVNAMYIDSIVYARYPYEGHFYHSYVRLRDEEQSIQFFKGDMIIPMGKETDRFVMEVLEPVSEDSYFRWNFFDEILQQKEWFSDYVFNEIAADLLEKDNVLKKAFNNKKTTDPAFAQNTWAQLYFIYTHSVYYEKSHNRYPVYRLEYRR